MSPSSKRSVALLAYVWRRTRGAETGATYKISAFEMLDWDIIKAVRETGKPIVMSVRPRSGLTILWATDYDGTATSPGLSAHGPLTPMTGAPMVEYHLKLPDVETPDSEFSLTPTQFRAMVRRLR